MFVQTLYEQLENTTHLCSWNVHTNSQGTDLQEFVGGPINIHHTDIGKKIYFIYDYLYFALWT